MDLDCGKTLTTVTWSERLKIIAVLLLRKPLKDRKATIVAQTLASHNLPTNRARELIKPSTDLASLRLEIEKKFFRLGFWVLFVLRHNESIFGHFWRLCLALGASPMLIFFRSKFFWFVTRKRDFMALDWLASTPGDKILAQKPSFKPSKDSWSLLY